MRQDTMDTADMVSEGLPVDSLVERSQSMIRNLSDAREESEQGAARLIHAYETVQNANRELSEELQARDLALAGATERVGRLESEVEKLKGLSREAIQAVKVAQDERDRAREDIRVSQENFAKLNATHENLIATNAKLMTHFERLMNQVESGSRNIRDGSRRLSDMVAPTPARPRAPRTAETPDAVLEREVREAATLAASRTPPRLVASEGARRGEPEILDEDERADVDGLLGRLAAVSGRASA
jgi:chromosome segregation ATPase